MELNLAKEEGAYLSNDYLLASNKKPDLQIGLYITII